MEGFIPVHESDRKCLKSERTLKRVFDLLAEGIEKSSNPMQTRIIHQNLDKLLLLSSKERDKLVKEIIKFDGLENIEEHLNLDDQSE